MLWLLNEFSVSYEAWLGEKYVGDGGLGWSEGVVFQPSGQEVEMTAFRTYPSSPEETNLRSSF